MAPVAAHRVIDRLKSLGCLQAAIREGNLSKAGPIKTDQDFYIVDAEFHPLLITEDIAAGKQGRGAGGIWEVEILAKMIKDIHGVLDVGIFCGPTGPEAARAGVIGGQRPEVAYFGMEDGTVAVRTAKSKRQSLVASYPLLSPTGLAGETRIDG